MGFRNDDEEVYDEEDEDELSGEEMTEVTELSQEDAGAGTAVALRIMFCRVIAFMLVFSPISFIMWKIGVSTGDGEMNKGAVSPLLHFIGNFCAVIPLAWVISESTEHLEKKVGPMLGTLLNSTFGNVVEIILSVTAIQQGKVKLVQSTLLGAMLMNTSGVLGLCFLVAGINFHHKKFNQYQATYNLSMLAVSALAMSVPTGLAVFDNFSTTEERLNLSRLVAFFLLMMYVQWIAFNLCTHSALFDKKEKKKGEVHWFWAHGGRTKGTGKPSKKEKYQPVAVADDETEESAEDDEPEIHWVCACTMLLISTVLVSFHCDWLVESIDPVCAQFKIKKAFIATVLLPMVGNFSEVIAAVSIACKGKLDLAMGVAIGSATQIALCVIPVAVFIAWGFGQNLDLDFEVFQVKLLVLMILVATLVVLDGEANWLKGSLLITAYMIIAMSFWFIHDREYVLAGEDPSATSSIPAFMGNSRHTKMGMALFPNRSLLEI